MNNIGDKGCKYISNIYMPNINKILLSKSKINIATNQISYVGLIHMSKSKWQNL